MDNEKFVPLTTSQNANQAGSLSEHITILSTTQCAHTIQSVADKTYDNAIYQLNSLQSNSSVLSRLRQRRSLNPEKNLEDMRQYLNDLNISISQLNELNVVHVAGTKGKGSTCALVESILRELGYKTGFYSSPHLVHVRERIRINSLPLTEAEFASNFFEVFNMLTEAIKNDTRELPAYFKFLTLMAFHVFVKEKVDVAILEVGIGGAFDCTNVVTKPIVCGITTLDLDHTSILGHTLPEIAWHKSGIMKEGSLALCVDQPDVALEVIKNRAKALNCSLLLTPDISEYKFASESSVFNDLISNYPGSNLSLALQLAKFWIERTKHVDLCPKLKSRPIDPVKASSFLVPEKFSKGMKTLVWKGRRQILRAPTMNTTFFLDGAHTPKSITMCAEWYSQIHLNQPTHVKHILLFTCTADRTPESLLPLLANTIGVQFEAVFFSTTQLNLSLDKRNETTNLNANEEEQLQKCQLNKKLWTEKTGHNNGQTFSCISDAISELETLSTTFKNCEFHVLVTGSLHLVGGVLSIVEKFAV